MIKRLWPYGAKIGRKGGGDMDNKKIKIGIFLGLTFLASVFLGRAGGKFFAYNFFEFLGIFWEFLLKAVLRLMVAGLAFCLPALFLTSRELFLPALLFNSLGFLLGFWLVAGSHDLGAGIVLALLFLVCQHSFFRGVQGRAKKFVSFFPRDIFVPKAADLLFYLALVFSLSFCLALKKQVAGGEFVIPEKMFEQVMGPATQVFQKKLQEGLKQEFGREIEEKIGTQNPEELLKLLQEEAKETAGEGELRQELGFRPELFELETLDLKELRRKFQEVIRPFLKYLPFLAAFSLFFTLRIVSSFLMIFLPWLISLMFKVLIKFGVFKIVEERETVRRISL